MITKVGGSGGPISTKAGKGQWGSRFYRYGGSGCPMITKVVGSEDPYDH